MIFGLCIIPEKEGLLEALGPTETLRLSQEACSQAHRPEGRGPGATHMNGTDTNM